MHQHVLRVAVAVLEHPQKLREFRVNAMHADLDEGALAGLLDRFLDLLLRLAHNLFDASGMDAAFGYQMFEGNARDLSPDWVMSRDDGGHGSVVVDNVVAGTAYGQAILSSSCTILSHSLNSIMLS